MKHLLPTGTIDFIVFLNSPSPCTELVFPEVVQSSGKVVQHRKCSLNDDQQYVYKRKEGGDKMQKAAQGT